MKSIALILLACLALAPTVVAETGLHRCAGVADTASACVDYDAVNDVCVKAEAGGETREVCIIFVGPPI